MIVAVLSFLISFLVACAIAICGIITARDATGREDAGLIWPFLALLLSGIAYWLAVLVVLT